MGEKKKNNLIEKNYEEFKNFEAFICNKYY